MGMFIPEDKFYDETKRQVGFNRYKQLISRHWADWMKINALTILGALPLILGILLAINTSSILVLFPCSLLGGLIYGPFLSGLYDSILRALRDDPMPWWSSYKKSWRQNFRCSLIPGAILGVTMGVFSFTGMLFWWAEVMPSLGTVLMTLFSLLLVTIFFQLYWIQMVLFQQTAMIRLRNTILFCIQHCWKVIGVGILQILYWGVYLLFAPWTLLLLPIIGIWYILFVTIHILYPALDSAFQIEEQFAQQ